MIDKFEAGKKYRFINKYKAHAFKNVEFECLFDNNDIAVLQYYNEDEGKTKTYSEYQISYAFENYEEIKTPEIIHERIYLYYDRNPSNDSDNVDSTNSYINYDNHRHWGNLGYIKIEYDKANSNIIDIELVKTKLKE